MLNNLLNNILGRLTLKEIPIMKDKIITITFFFVIFISIIFFFIITFFKLWNKIWYNWFISVDHKKIGIMYIILAIIMLIRGFADALMMRIHQAISFGNSHGFLSSDHYSQIFTAHGVIMIFFVAMPLIIGIMNYIIPLQIGARDVAFPILNNISFWMTFFGAILIMISLFIGEFAHTGWLSYPPLSGIINSPGVGVDYYIWSLQIAGIGTILSSINFITTIIKMRAPGMNLMKMPIFTWTTLCSNILIVISFPILTSVLSMLAIDRIFNANFFTNDLGGNIMMYINLIWMWGHPEVYILILPAFGIFSEVTSTFCKKKLFGYNSMIYASIVITILSYIVWLHHFFTMGSGANINAFFGITTMIIAIPTGVKIFNWLFTMYKGKVSFKIPMLWTIGFISTFTIGGMAGVLLSIPPIDFSLHNSLFLVAHFHNVIIGGVIFGIFAGINYWFPKVFGYKLNSFYGYFSFFFWLIGFYIAFIPLYFLGLMGVTRRLDHFDDKKLQIWFKIAALGTLIILLGIIFFILQLIISYLTRKKLKVKNNPWHGTTLEWFTSSPPIKYNFKYIPKISKNNKYIFIKNKNQKIHKFKNTKMGFLIGIFSMIFVFTIIWYMWILTIISFIIILFLIIKYNISFKKNKNFLKQKNSKTLLGFWIYLMSDCLIFTSLFIAHSVIGKNYAFAPNANTIFNFYIIIINTVILLLSSLTCNIASIYIKNYNNYYIKLWLCITGLLGTLFIFFELYEIIHLINHNISPSKSAFITSFFTLIFTHGLHVIFGIIWILILILKNKKINFKKNIKSFKCLSMFWHFLDIIWLCIFLFVYLLGIL